MDNKFIYESLKCLIKQKKYSIIFISLCEILDLIFLNFSIYIFGIHSIIVPVIVGGFIFGGAWLIMDILDYRFYSKHLKRIKEEENL